MEFTTLFYGVVVSGAMFLAIIFAFVIPPILAGKGEKYKKYIKFIAPLSPIVILVAATLRIFLEETQWVATSQPPYILCSTGTAQLIFLLILLYFSGVMVVRYCERKDSQTR